MTTGLTGYILLGLGLPWAAGLGVVSALTRPRPFGWPEHCFRYASAYLLGVALSSALVHLAWWLNLSLHHVAAPGLIGLSLFGFAIVRIRRRQMMPVAHPAPRRRMTKAETFAALMLGILIVLRLLPLAHEVLMRPTLPWDAWTTWAYQAKALWLTEGRAVFMPTHIWLAEDSELAFANAAHGYPTLIAGYQSWLASQLGQWHEPLVNFPWWLALVSASTLLVSEVKRQTGSTLLALLVGYIWISLPLVNAHVALAGYMDLWLASGLLMTACLILRALELRTRMIIVLSVTSLLMLPFIKREGVAWSGTALLTLLLMRLGWRRGITLAGLLVLAFVMVMLVGVDTAIGRHHVVINTDLIALPYLGRFNLDLSLPWRAMLQTVFLSTDWHLLFPLLLGACLLGLRWRPAQDIPARWLLGFSGLGALGLVLLFYATGAGKWAEDLTSLDRLLLQWTGVWLLAGVVAHRSRLLTLTGGGQFPLLSTRIPPTSRS